MQSEVLETFDSDESVSQNVDASQQSFALAEGYPEPAELVSDRGREQLLEGLQSKDVTDKEKQEDNEQKFCK